ncbi:S41 family peptidase [Sungkyunkwania multivorans]|uniref:S41 family peptidase n=1 Tax=Sungkyunkwania multivorans TaxID=1173618 RepID=A0ABW3D151_9FLAO
MKKDLQVFKDIRFKANSGLHKYRSVKEIDSIYKWAEEEIKNLSTYGEFYNLICTLTDFEGSVHNETFLISKISASMKMEESGYFPYPIKLIEGKVIVNFETGKIPLGAEILAINDRAITTIIPELFKYYTTDGKNISGKSIGINSHFSKYYRLNYGLEDTFQVTYRQKESNELKHTQLKSVSYASYYRNFAKRYSIAFDKYTYQDCPENEIYHYKSIDNSTGKLTINSFSMGNEKTVTHKRYVRFLDSVFMKLKEDRIENLILDIRNNTGGTDPNDLVTYSYLAARNFVENKEAWISFNKIPELRHIKSNIPAFLRPFGVGKYNKMLRRSFPLEKNGKFYQDSSSADHMIRKPSENAFRGTIYLLISPSVASAGSLFAAMVAGNKNSIVIGEETAGGYYGHNGHTPLSYVLPRSKIVTQFSIVNLEQDVPSKKNQIYGRGIIPDYEVMQKFEDFLSHTDTQMNFTLDLIETVKPKQ